ncbi:hypothetical protein FACS1894172_17670 [Spirochaetia bacterium]|nr:hypothetical protein FACS1894164_11250 [Spirochaetia bacterium]GHU35625.1 hypothetical protein FACS1894172_17670 [Spirochaetia bacterium]
MGIGRIPIGASAAGEIKVSGKKWLNRSVEPDLEWVMIDAKHSKVHPDACGARGGNDRMRRTKGG